MSLTLAVFVLGWPSFSRAAGATLRLVPAQAEIGLGETFDFEVIVSNVTNLFAIDVVLTFEPTLLEVVDLDPSREGVQIRPGQFPYPDFLAEHEVLNDFGTIWYAASQVSPRPPLSGSGTVLTVRFRGKSPGRAEIQVADLTLADPQGLEIPVESTAGAVVVVLEPGVFPNRPSPTPTPSPGVAFTMTPSPTREQPTRTSEATLTSPTRDLPITPTSTPFGDVYPLTTPPLEEAYPLPASATPQVMTGISEEPSTPTPVTEQTVGIAEPTFGPETPVPSPGFSDQLTATPAKVAVVIPTLRGPRLDKDQRPAQEPLIPRELFIAFIILLVVLSGALLVRLMRRAKDVS